MTLQSLMIAYLDRRPLGAQVHYPAAYEEARPATLEQLLTAQDLLEEFRAELHDRIGASSLAQPDYARAAALGVLLPLVMRMLDQLKEEIDQLMESG